MAADLEQLESVLQAELRSGCEDSSFEGGLDELLRLQARNEQPRSPVLRMVAALPARGYGSLDPEERKRWARRAVATVVHERASARTAPTRRAPSKRASARSAARARTKPQAAAPEPTHREPPRHSPAKDLPEGKAALGVAIADTGTRLGSANLARIDRLGLHTVGDALRHYPYRYRDFSKTVPISSLRVGEEQTIRGTVDRARETRMGRGGRMRATEATISDEAGARIRVVWFNQPYLAKQLPPGTDIALSGTVKVHRGRPSLDNPEFERISDNPAHTGRIVPVYHLTSGLAQRTLRQTIARLLDRFAERIPEALPEEMRSRLGLMGIVEATRQAHYPDDDERLREAQRRLAFDELLSVQLGVVHRKREWQESGNAAAIDGRATAERFTGQLPYELTAAQQRALDDVIGDVSRTVPMARMLQGDVGSGKTVVALTAMLTTVAAGHQAVMMAPTEVLADQHFRTICTLLSGDPEPPLNGLVRLPFLPLPLRIVLLTGSTRAKERRDAYEAIRHGGAQIVVGTHALIQDQVDFQSLALAVVDEQHRFGVMQRSALRSKGAGRDEGGTPHLLVMSATPIPRSLALTVFGDLDLSVIDELPRGRTPIATEWLPPHRRHEAFAALREEIRAGRQAFVICPLVEGSEAVASRAATEEFERLRVEEFPELADRIELLHGRMSGKQKDAVMQRFDGGEAAILVSTSVVEVGIDVPNATVMIIEGADRFGLAQLHQFRGRVGRGEHPSRCYLLADDPSEEAEERLSTVARTTDGFQLAQADLELRGPGELFGTKQSGTPSLHVASLLDPRLIEAARREAEALLDKDRDLTAPEHAELRLLAARAAEGLVAEEH